MFYIQWLNFEIIIVKMGERHSTASVLPPRCCYNPNLIFSVTSVMNSMLVSLSSSRSYKIICNSLVHLLSAFPIAVRIARSTFNRNSVARKHLNNCAFKSIKIHIDKGDDCFIRRCS